MKTKIKSYGYKVTNFNAKEIPKVDSNHTCLVVVSLDSALQKDENYYLEVFLKDHKYIKNGNYTYCWWLRKFFWLFW